MWWWQWRARAQRLEMEMVHSAQQALRLSEERNVLSVRLRRLEEMLAQHNDDLPYEVRIALEKTRRG